MITISNLSNKKKGNNFTFSDIHLDLEQSLASINKRNTDAVSGNDIIIDSDKVAIFNSIRNIFTQRRYLNPAFDNKLAKYIGTPVSQMAAHAIGEDIDRALVLFEPRVKVIKILVKANSDNNSYGITIFLSLPNFSNEQLMMMGNFSNDGRFDFINR